MERLDAVTAARELGWPESGKQPNWANLFARANKHFGKRSKHKELARAVAAAEGFVAATHWLSEAMHKANRQLMTTAPNPMNNSVLPDNVANTFWETHKRMNYGGKDWESWPKGFRPALRAEVHKCTDYLTGGIVHEHWNDEKALKWDKMERVLTKIWEAKQQPNHWMNDRGLEKLWCWSDRKDHYNGDWAPQARQMREAREDLTKRLAVARGLALGRQLGLLSSAEIQTLPVGVTTEGLASKMLQICEVRNVLQNQQARRDVAIKALREGLGLDSVTV